MARASYRSPLRAENAARTRETILAAGRDLFARDGYEAVTVEQLARAAGVASPTVYASVGGKRELLLALCRQAVEAPEAQDATSALSQATTGHDAIAITVAGARAVNERHAVTMRIAADAHSVPEARALWQEGLDRTRAVCIHTAEHLDRLNALRPGLTTTQAATTLITLIHPNTLRTLVEELQLSWEDAEAWLHDACARLLLDATG